MRVLYEGLGDSKYRPCPLLVQYVDAGKALTVVLHCSIIAKLLSTLPLIK